MFNSVESQYRCPPLLKKGLPSLATPPQYHQNLPDISNLREDDWEWEPNHRRNEVVCLGKKVSFHPQFAFGSAGIRGTKELTSDTIAYWEVRTLQNMFGTSTMFGVGTLHMNLNKVYAFGDQLGSDEFSYGLSHRGRACHAGINVRFCEGMPGDRACIVGILFNGPDRTISYFVDGTFIGTPFTHIDVSRTMYPTIASTAQQSHFMLERQGSIIKPLKLFDIAMDQVHKLVLSRRATIDNLPLPPTIRSELTQRHNHHQCRQRREDLRKTFLAANNARTMADFRPRLSIRKRHIGFN